MFSRRSHRASARRRSALQYSMEREIDADEEQRHRALRQVVNKQERALRRFQRHLQQRSVTPAQAISIRNDVPQQVLQETVRLNEGLSAQDKERNAYFIEGDSVFSAAMDRSTTPPYTPPRTPVDRINYYTAVTILPEPEEPNPELLWLQINNRTFVLCYKDLLAGGPANAFLKAWQGFDGPLNSTERLVISLEDRDSDLFEVIYGYLKGEQVIPLSETLSLKLCGEEIPTQDVYERLYNEAKQLGIHSMMERLASVLKQGRMDGPLPAQLFRLYDAMYNTPLREEDVGRFVDRVNAGHSLANHLRAVVIGAAVNFAVRMIDGDTPVLDYSLQAPMSDMSEAFCRLVDCRSEEAPDCFVIEGTLTLDQCRNIPLKIIYKDICGNPNLPDDSLHYKTSTRHTLYALLQYLHPAHQGDTPEHFGSTFTMSSSSNGDDADSGTDDDEEANPDSNSTRNSPLLRWMSLRYATVTLRFEGLQRVPLSPQVALELVHTATIEVLELEEGRFAR